MDKRKWEAYLAIHKKAETGGRGVDTEPVETFFHYVEKVKEIMPPDKYPKLLEVGAGAGDETKAFMDAGYEVTGITFGIDNIKYAKEKYGITLLEIDMHDLPPFWKNTFDGAIVIHTLEHALAPIVVIGELYFVLKDYGRVYVAVPDPNAEQSKVIWHTSLLYPEQVKYYFEYWGFKTIRSGETHGRQGWDKYEFAFEKLPPGHPDFKNWGYLQHIYRRLERL